MTKKLFRFSLSFFAVGTLTQALDYKKLSDVIVISLPIAALGFTIYLNDKEGIWEFSRAMGTNLLVTSELKYTIPAIRPDGGSHSFPSGHTSIAFTSAAYIHRRYNLSHAIPMYALSTLTAYSRVRARKHYLRDVAAGAVLGTGIGYWMSKRFHGISVHPGTSGSAMGLTLLTGW